MSTLLVFVLGTAGVVGWLTFLRAPDNAPSAACGAEPTRPRLVAAGASMTQGSLGADWVGAVRARHPAYEVVNAGVNGNKVADLLARVETDVVACRPAAVTLLIGTNDVRDDVPPDRYRADLRTVVERVKTTGARVALMSLPPLGEDLDAGPNLRLPAYNAAVKEVAAVTGAAYLPLYERMAGTLRQAGPPHALRLQLPPRTHGRGPAPPATPHLGRDRGVRRPHAAGGPHPPDRPRRIDGHRPHLSLAHGQALTAACPPSAERALCRCRRRVGRVTLPP
ncbi:SGNH/GDSL hydrolase family protein [Nonomuraea salmonea]|uniref:SGNH/GDSL hydrolase family protein n=1 Tax=Nonomuraea salmonea TaxID=46181 RepID=UPI0031EFC307